jgi:hypothetical protein
MPLNYLRDDCHKQEVTNIRESRWFKSMYTLQGKSDQHATCFPCSVHVWPLIIRISHGPHIATFRTIVNSDEQSHCSGEKGLPAQSTARQLTYPWVHTQFLSQASHWSSEGKASICWQQTSRLTGPITPAYDRYIQYLLVGATALKVHVFHTPLPDLPNRWSSLST